VPKNLSFSIPDKAVLVLAPPLVFFGRLVKPLIVALNSTANGVLRLFRVEPKHEANSTYTLEEVATIVSESTREGVLRDGTGALSATFEFTTRKVRDVAVPLTDLISLPESASPADVEKAVTKHGFSRYVLVTPEGEPTGYVHLKDVIDLDGDAGIPVTGSTAEHGLGSYADPIPAKRIRQLVSIYEGTDLEDALATMRRSGAHLARSFTAVGATTGVLFLEDIIEELVGEVQDATRRL